MGQVSEANRNGSHESQLQHGQGSNLELISRIGRVALSSGEMYTRSIYKGIIKLATDFENSSQLLFLLALQY